MAVDGGWALSFSLYPPHTRILHIIYTRAQGTLLLAKVKKTDFERLISVSIEYKRDPLISSVCHFKLNHQIQVATI